MYKERTTSDITICRPTLSGTAAEVQTVPISEDSKRVFKLMSEDYVELHFTLAEAVAFEVGDYIDDELFGRFVITEKQMPSYNTSTGGYDYTLKFEREYRKWKNKMFMLTSVLTASGDRVRKEADWSLTDAMESHVAEIINNLIVIGDTDYTYNIEGAEKRNEVKNLSYSAQSILAALTTIADAYECEWWVTYDSLDAGTIHFGKCEDTDGDEQTFSLDTNVESMNIQDDNSTYCNRLYAFGATTNMPSSYRKSLTFKVEATRTSKEGYTEYLPDKELTMDMLAGGSWGTIGFVKNVSASNFGNQSVYIKMTRSKTDDGYTLKGSTKRDAANELITRGGTISFSGTFTYKPYIITTNIASGITYTVEIFVEDSKGNSVGTLFTDSQIATSLSEGGALPIRVDFDSVDLKLAAGTYHVVMAVTIESSKTQSVAFSVQDEITGASADKCISLIDGSTTKDAYVNLYPAIFETTTATDEGWTGRTVFYFANSSVKLDVNDEFTIDFYDGEQRGLLISKIPMSWFASDYDNPSALSQIGDNRLMLPVETGSYLQPNTSLLPDQIVEMAVAFDNIYPRCVLRITGVTTEDKKTTEEYEDSSKTTWEWTQYKLTAQTLDGQSFNFEKSFIKDGETLQIKFLTEKEATEAWQELGKDGEPPQPEDGYRLAGMTFDVSFRNLTQLYTIVRNDDYGAMLPNETLWPAVGDPFILVGWDVRAIEQLGLIAAAEKRLQAAAEEYMQAIQDDQFTFTCNMMSEPPEKFSYNSMPFITSDSKALNTSREKPFYVRKGTRFFQLFNEGTRVHIQHQALSEDKHSRIIGYQYKVDIPYDSPQYTVGETDAYSRIKQMEKEITKLGGN